MNLICFINSIYFLIIFKAFFWIILIIIFKRLDNISISKSKRFINFNIHLSKSNIYYFRNHEQKIGGGIGLSYVKRSNYPLCIPLFYHIHLT